MAQVPGIQIFQSFKIQITVVMKFQPQLQESELGYVLISEFHSSFGKLFVTLLCNFFLSSS